jgi:hypothetical protein
VSDPNEKLDLSCLDLAPDDLSLDEATALVMSRVLEDQAQRQSLWSLLGAYSKWAAGLATATAAVFWFLALSAPKPAPAPTAPQPEAALLSWSEPDAEPSVTEMLVVLGDAP